MKRFMILVALLFSIGCGDTRTPYEKNINNERNGIGILGREYAPWGSSNAEDCRRERERNPSIPNYHGTGNGR